jgi:hypothetical protein
MGGQKSVFWLSISFLPVSDSQVLTMIFVINDTNKKKGNKQG